MNKNYVIRDLEEKDIPEVLKLNDKLVHYLSPMDEELLKTLHRESELFKVVEIQGVIGAFLIVIKEGKNYESINYKWFMERFPEFLYIDRVVIDDNFQRLGLGKALYNEVIKRAKELNISTISAEIDILPENPTSLKFHKVFNFKEVGTQMVAGGKKRVSLQTLSL